jgi:hypothetical protein
MNPGRSSGRRFGLHDDEVPAHRDRRAGGGSGRRSSREAEGGGLLRADGWESNGLPAASLAAERCPGVPRNLPHLRLVVSFVVLELRAAEEPSTRFFFDST